MKKPIVLTGFMGVGKTTIGKQLAKRLGVEFFDIDAMIEKEEGRTVSEIFGHDGEEYFRTREADVFRRLIDKDSAVIATGGGTFENPEVRKLVKDKAISVCLQSSLTGLLKRMDQLKEKRPMLKGKTEEEIRALYARREMTYAGCDIFVRVEGIRADVADDIIRLLKVAGELA